MSLRSCPHPPVAAAVPEGPAVPAAREVVLRLPRAAVPAVALPVALPVVPPRPVGLQVVAAAARRRP